MLHPKDQASVDDLQCALNRILKRDGRSVEFTLVELAQRLLKQRDEEYNVAEDLTLRPSERYALLVKQGVRRTDAYRKIWNEDPPPGL